MKRIVFALTVLGLASGCSIIGVGQEKDTPTFGERIPVLAPETDIEVDPAIAGIPVTIPAPVMNTAWTQPGGNAAKAMGHVALGGALTRAWSADINGGNERTRLAAAPVVADGRVYAVDTTATLRAFNAETGSVLWTSRVGDPADLKGGRNFWTGEFTGNGATVFGGGVSYDNGRLYATNGLGDTVAFDAATGAQLWRVRHGGPLRGAPTIAYDTVFVVSQDNQLYALDPVDGRLRWTGIGTLESANVFGAAAPAAAQGTVVAGFSSGELNAYRYENGRIVWQDALARTSISTSAGALSDVDAEPVIDNGRVYAIGQGGRMVALELVTGQRVWEINVAGISTPAVAGEWLFVVTDQAQLLAVARASGQVRWMTQLPRFANEKSKEGRITWTGPILAGNRLVLANSVGDLVNISPIDGSFQSRVQIKNPISLPPVVANNTLYVLDDKGQLSAWR